MIIIMKSCVKHVLITVTLFHNRNSDEHVDWWTTTGEGDHGYIISNNIMGQNNKMHSQKSFPFSWPDMQFYVRHYFKF